MVVPEEVEPEYLALVTPMTLPSMSKRGPPELPELMAALVWSMFWGLPSVLISRFRALMMPLVMVQVSSPSGLPMATTDSPTWRLSESPTLTGWSPSASIFSTAMS